MNRNNDILHKKWSQQVKKRDGNRCVVCGKKSKWNHAHHLDGYDWFAAGRYVVSNGVTLCGNYGKNGRVGCHKLFHQKYGNGKNTRGQFYDFKRMMKK